MLTVGVKNLPSGSQQPNSLFKESAELPVVTDIPLLGDKPMCFMVSQILKNGPDVPFNWSKALWMVALSKYLDIIRKV